MNMSGGIALIRKTWLSWMQHRSFFFLLAFMWMIPPLIYLFVWITAAGGGSIKGYDRSGFVAYYLTLIVVNQITYSQTNWTVGDQIRMGTMNVLLLRPLSPIFDAVASEIAGKVVYLVFIIPISFLLGELLKPAFDIDPRLFLLFIVALVLAWVLRFIWGYWIALLAFWSTRADALLALQDTLIFLFAGQVAPVVLLPKGRLIAAKILPFRYMIGFPVELLTGHLEMKEIILGFIYQIGWIVISVILFYNLWRNGTRNYTAVGG